MSLETKPGHEVLSFRKRRVFSQLDVCWIVLLSWIGLFLGMMFIGLALVGFILIWAGIILRWPAIAYREDREWSMWIYTSAFGVTIFGVSLFLGGLIHLFLSQTL